MTTQGASGMRMAIVHEWINAYAGSEQVFEALAQTFPMADLFALSREQGVSLDLGSRPVRTTFLDHAFMRRHRAMALPLMPAAWRALGKSRYDVVLSSHHAFAHANRLADGGKHLCYVHTPARYLWSPDVDRRGASWFKRPGAAILRRYDVAATRRVTAYAANSSTVAGRIRDFWHREATVIHPGVRVEYFGQASDVLPTRDYVLGAGRWIAYKGMPLVIEAAGIAGMPVKIAGSGPDKDRILAAATAAAVPVELIESPSDEHLRDLYRNAACLVFPTVEDFGIVPVEAQAAGTPVVAIADGGALDTIRDGETGYLVSEPTAQALAERILDVGQIGAADCQINAARFTHAEFARRIREWVEAMVPR